VIARAPVPYLLGWPFWASIAVHGAAIATASTVVALTPHAPPPVPAPVEVVRVEPPPPPPPPPPERPKPVVRERTVTRRVITQPIEQPRSMPAPALLSEAPTRTEASPMNAPTNSPSRMSGPPGAQNWALSGTPGGSATGSGKLFSTGDIGLPAGGGNRQETASTQQRASSSGGNPTDLTSFARPLGGYQTRPRYPDSARRQGIEGEALLRFEVLTDGHVASVTVTRSAGHPDLDRAAVDAVKTWRFEPARRGEEKVAVWVTLPVRFQLQSGLLSE
jgi:protein TonB